jgi:hypothetical protein
VLIAKQSHWTSAMPMSLNEQVEALPSAAGPRSHPSGKEEEDRGARVADLGELLSDESWDTTFETLPLTANNVGAGRPQVAGGPS